MNNKKRIINTIFVAFVLIFLAGCAAQGPYLRLDSSLNKDIRTFEGVEYVPLPKLCNVYGLDYKWDSFIKKATIQAKSEKIVLRAASDRILVNGQEKRLDRSVILDGGTIFVPVSFVKKDLFPSIGVKAPVEMAPARPVSNKISIKTIVLDAGHGGKDPGATGRRLRLKEKKLTLEVTKRVKKILENNGIRVIMTRDKDEFISLPKRVEIANRSGADLFVSIHLNASRSKSLRGFECYVLSDATDDNARAIEAFENASLKMGQEANAERSTHLDKTLWDMTLTENRFESAELANHICGSIESNEIMDSRGMRSARFYVLKYTVMPSVLVEAGYLSNRYEETKMKDEKYIDRLADAIGEGILKYKEKYERTEGFTNI